MGLFKPSYKSLFLFRRKNWIHRADAKNTEHQRIIVDIAKNDGWFEVSREALKKVTNPEDIAWIAINHNLNGSLALEMLTDQKLIAKVALNANSAVTRSGAVRRLNDQKTLAQVLKKEKDGYIRI